MTNKKVRLEDAKITTRHTGKLQQIREDKAKNGKRGKDDRGNSTPGLDAHGLADRTSERVDEQAGDRAGEVGGREEGISGEPGAAGRSDFGIRPADGASEYPDRGNDPMVRRAEGEGRVEQQPPASDPEAEAEAKRERHRQAQARYEQKLREEKSASDQLSQAKNLIAPGRVPDNQPPSDEDVEFRILGLPEGEERTFTIKEADENLDKLIFLYTQGSSILDDILEIIVKGHEPVKIWALDEDEAHMLATMQMERAKKDKAAARVVRVMLKVYDRLYFLMLVGPRLKATGSHVKAHGGFSFR